MLSWLEQSLFADKLRDDTRTPWTTFALPGLEGTFGLYAPLPGVWQQLVYVSTNQRVDAILHEVLLCNILASSYLNIPRLCLSYIPAVHPLFILTQ